MGPLTITILLGLTSLSIQKSDNLNDPQESLDLETFVQNLLTEGRDRYNNDVSLKINVNRNKKKAEALTKVQYLGEISSEKEIGFKKLNKKLAKLLDGLQQRVMNEDTRDPTCSCDYASERWPGVLKCQCGDLSEENDEDRREESREAEKDDKNDFNQEHRLDESNNQKHEDRREDGSYEDEYSQLKFRSDYREDNYWADNNWCDCKLLRSTGDDNDLTHYLRCKCNSPERAGSKDDRNNGYWTDDTSCGCEFLRNTDGKNELRCRICESSTRIGDDKENNREIDYLLGDNKCGCQLLRNIDDDKDIQYLRCRCNSPKRTGSKDDGYWTDDTSCGCEFLRNTDGKNELRCRICESSTRIDDDKENDREEEYLLGDDRCGCQLLRNIDEDKDTQYLRCRCNSPERSGSKDDGYWTDDTSCGCEFLRNTDGKNELRCRMCEPPAGRVGDDKKGDREEGYWSDDNYCGCRLLRNIDDAKNIKYLRCRCNSPSVAEHFTSFRSVHDDNIGPERFGTVLSDLSDADFYKYDRKHLDRNLNEQKLNSVLNFILKKDNAIDLSNLPSMKRKVLLKLRDIMPPLRNIDANILQAKIASIMDGNINQLREKNQSKKKQKSHMENPLTADQIQRLLKIIEQQKKTKDKNQMYRRNMPEDPIGVPFTYRFKGLAQINT